MANNYVIDDLQSKQVYDIAVCSGVGKRESQQDAAYIAASDHEVFAVVCDGMGGVAGGQLASSTAVEAFVEYYQVYAQHSSSDSKWLQYTAEAVDDIVYSLADSNGKRIGAGTTLLSVVVREDRLHWLSVGDSRIYIFRENEMVQVTNDHNYFMQLNQQKADGIISTQKYKEEAQSGEALISYLGMGGLALMDINEEAFLLNSGDVILLCTDGLYRTVLENEIKIILSESDSMYEVADYLEKLILHRALPYQDNYTYVLIKKI